MTGGRVQVVAEGSRAACARLLTLLRGDDPPGTVALVVETFGAVRGERGFVER